MTDEAQVFFSVANPYRTIVEPAIAHLACLHVNHFTEGSRVPPPMPRPSGNGLSRGDIGGIVVGSVFGALLIAGLGYCLWRRKVKSSQESPKLSFWARHRHATEMDAAEAAEATPKANELSEEAEKRELPAPHETLELSGENIKRAELQANVPAELPADSNTKDSKEDLNAD